jgi:hypothetical protein
VQLFVSSTKRKVRIGLESADRQGDDGKGGLCWYYLLIDLFAGSLSKQPRLKLLTGAN